MRIIAGKFKNHNIAMVPSDTTRETSDKVRGAVFNSLASKVIDAVVLDLFAGSGSYGLEAISRGAKEITFVDSHPLAIKTLGQNIAKLKVNEQCNVIPNDYKKALETIVFNQLTYDLIFIDPPYNFSKHNELLEKLELISNQDSTLIIEVQKNTVIDFDQTNYTCYKETVYGIKKILYVSKKKNRKKYV